MTTLKTIVATTVIAVGGTVAAFTGLHLGQPPADAAPQAQPVKAKTTCTVAMSAKDLAKLAALMNGRQTNAAEQAKVHDRSRTHQKPQVHKKQQTTHRVSTHSGTRSTTNGGATHAQHGTVRTDGHSSSGATHHGGGSGHGSGGHD